MADDVADVYNAADYQWPNANRVVPPGAGAEPAAPEATGSEEISVDGQPVIVEGDGGETLEKTRSHTSTVAVTDRVSDDDCFMLSNMTVELVNIPQLSGGYLNSNALCILLRIPLFNSGHY